MGERRPILRELQELSQTELAGTCTDISQATISAIENSRVNLKRRARQGVCSRSLVATRRFSCSPAGMSSWGTLHNACLP